MNLHEYQGKLLFAEYNLPVSKGKVILMQRMLLTLVMKLEAINGLLRHKCMLVEEVNLEVSN